ncbi:MAG: hypothetical protein WBA22_08460 [Candidatus Methanofastidiosia archaeon]
MTPRELEEKREAYRKGAITQEEALQWILHQLQRKAATDEYHVLLGFYWHLCRPNEAITFIILTLKLKQEHEQRK